MSFSPQYCLTEPLPLSIASYDLSLLPAKWELLAKIEPEDFGGVVRYVDSTGRVTVAVDVCGTRSKLDGKPNPEQWLHDLDFLKVPNPFGPGMIHRGFLEYEQMIHESIWNAVDKVSYDALLLIAHSLGCSLATGFAAQLAKFRPEYAALVTGYLFESPRVFDREAATDFNAKFPNWYRIVNHGDIVPQLPPQNLGFEHVGVEIPVYGGFEFSNPHVAHSLDSGVRPGLERLVGKG